MAEFDVTKLDQDQIEGIVITDNKNYAKRVDFINDNLLYKGWAAIGSSTADALWRIVKITLNDQGDVIEEWADGNDLFDNIWDNREGLTYV